MKQNQKVHSSRRQSPKDTPMSAQFMLDDGSTITVSHLGDRIRVDTNGNAYTLTQTSEPRLVWCEGAVAG